MEYRASPTSVARTLTWDDFHAMVRRGEVAPVSLVRAPVITGSDWWTADNLAVFHRESPGKYPLGHHLAAELERARQEQERQARISAALRPIHDACELPWMVEDCYGLTPLEVVVTQPGVIGASRLTISAAFEPEFIVTCAFTSRDVHVEAVTGSMDARTALWLQWFRRELVPDLEFGDTTNVPPLEIRRETLVLPLAEAPRPFRSWKTLLTMARAAHDCEHLALDGASFAHDVRGGDIRLRAGWTNPRRDADPLQFSLVAAYRKMLRATGLGRD